MTLPGPTGEVYHGRTYIPEKSIKVLHGQTDRQTDDRRTGDSK